MGALIVGFEDFVQELSTLISTYPPSFIYIYDPISPRTTGRVLKSTISDIRQNAEHPADSDIYHVHLDAICCFTQRLLFDTILNSLSNKESSRQDAPSTADAMALSERWSASWDSFIHGLQHLHSIVRGESMKDIRFVISIEQAQKLKETLPDSVIPLTRLNELSQLDITVIFLSQTPWQGIKPSLGASPEPYYIDIKPLSKSDIIKNLSSRFSSISQETRATSSKHAQCYDASLSQLYTHYITMICDVCFPFTHDIDELAYIAAARWPGFVKPILSTVNTETLSPSEDTRLRLIRLFNPTITNALESLYPRLMNATDWAAANEPDPNILNEAIGQAHLLTARGGITSVQQDDDGLLSLPRMSKFILVAAYIASTNPAKSDLRMFGRGLDEKKRKRRFVKTQSKTKGPSKIPQQLLGPSPFPIDRMIAILGALLEENDVDTRRPAPEFTIPGEETDMEISRVAVYNAIMELTSMHLLLRTSQSDRIDASPMFKCAISHDTALLLAKQLDVPLNDLLWETP